MKIFTLDQAPCNLPLSLLAIDNENLAESLARMGVYPGDTFSRLDEKAVQGPVRVQGPAGDVILSGSMAASTIVHHDDGHKTPVNEMLPGETGHVEGLLSDSDLSLALATLGIRANDPIRMVRRIPPMDYLSRTKRATVRLTEEMASKIWGKMDEKFLQFAMASRGRNFHVERILASKEIASGLKSQGIAPGETIFLSSVTPADNIGAGVQDPLILGMESGLRLYLPMGKAAKIRAACA